MFKESGKYYTSEDIECDHDIYAFKKEFIDFIKKNIPAHIGEGYIVVEDVGNYDTQSFHTALYRYEELF